MQIQDNTLNSIKEKMIDEVIEELMNMGYMTSLQKAAYKSEILSDIQSRTLATTLRLQSDLTDANAYNKTAYELYLDILTTFDYINELYDTLNKHQKLNQSIINTLHSTIGSLNDKLSEVEAIIGVKGHPECFIDSFRTSNNQETDTKYYRERYGEIVPKATYVKYNPDQETITLNYTRQQNVLMYKSGVQLGEIFLTKQYGSGFIKARNAEAKLENAISTSKSSYWSETILCDEEMKIKGMEYEDFEYLRQYNRSFYDYPKGALCEICIQFEAMTKINELILNPFGNFPIDVIAIRYSLTDDEDDDCYDVLCPNNEKYPWLTVTSLKKEYEFHFPEIKCKRLYILINQLHCIKDTYLISSDQMFKNELWFNATNPESEKLLSNNTMVFKPMYLDRAADDPIWLYINNKMNTNKQLDINGLLINNKNKMLPVTKYQYTYGFYNIIPNYSEFQQTGVYVSKEIQASGSIKSLSITTEEEHFNSEDNGRIISDIEYYVTTKENPEYSDWHSICPKNKDYIYCERLQLDYAYCYLRHKAVCGVIETYDKDGNMKPVMERPIVRMDDTVLTEDADYILRTDESGNVIAIEVSNIDHFALYTVSYTPTDDSKELNLISEDNPIPNNSYEVISGTGAACYELSNYPYYNHNNPEATNSYVKIINLDTGSVNIQSDKTNSSIQCVTNKLNPSDSYKNFIPNTTQYTQYYTNGKYVYFNRPILKNEKIEINYPSFDSKLRLKIILRKNSKRDFWVTPVLHNYKLEFTTL